MFAFRFTRKRYLMLAMLGILLPTLVLVFLTVRLQRQVFRYQNHILAETARFTAEYAVSQVQERIRAKEREIHMHFRMVAMLQRFEARSELPRVEQTYPYVACAFLMQPDRSFVFSSVSVSDSLHERARRILDEVLDPETVQHLLASSEPHFLRGQEGGEPFHLTVFGLFDGSGKPDGVAGFFLNLTYVRERFLAGLLEQSIAAAAENFSPDFGREFGFDVYDHNGQLVYAQQGGDKRSAGTTPGNLATAELWDVLPGWTVRLRYAGPEGPRYQRNLWLSNALLFGILGAIAIAGILVSMRFLLREMELAHLKSHFVSNITHELKTPLAAIQLYTETLEAGRFDGVEQEKRFLGIIRKETVRLTHLINNILDFARIEQGKKRYRFERTSVGDVVQGVVDAYAYQLRSQGCEVHLHVEPELPAVWLDRDAVSQAVLNLLDNAVKYSRERKEIDVQVGVEGADAVGIVVRDHGIGIPPHEQERIFAAFYRVEKGLEHDVKGSGLGLAVVKHVAEAHGGSVRLDSRQGEGSTFTLRLPVTSEPPPQPPEGRA